jgi:apolipoprotein N-acyltransferase
MEYGIPIFRLASSGISQIVDRSGTVLRTAPYPGDGAVIEGELEIGGRGRLPADHWLAPASAWMAGIVLCGLGFARLASARRKENHGV